MAELAQEYVKECDMAIALLKEQTISEIVLRARMKRLDSFRCDVDLDVAIRKQMAAYLLAGIENEIPPNLRLRAHHILFAREDNDPDSPLGKTGVLYSYADALITPTNTNWVVDGLFTPASVNLLCGEGGTKKTYAMIDLAVAVARGADWLEFTIPDPLVCLFVDEESGPRRFADRLQRVGRAHDADSDLPFYYISLAGFNLTSTDGQDELHKLVAETHAGLVILDALVDVMAGGDENAVSDVQPIFVGLRRIAEMTHSAILVIHHANRAGAYRGSSALKGAVDTMLMVSNDNDIVTFKTEKARDIEAITFHALANFGDGTFNLSPTMGTKKADAIQPLILSWLSGTEGLNQSELVKLGKKNGTGRNSVLSALAEMERAGLINISSGIGAAKLYSVSVV